MEQKKSYAEKIYCLKRCANFKERLHVSADFLNGRKYSGVWKKLHEIIAHSLIIFCDSLIVEIKQKETSICGMYFFDSLAMQRKIAPNCIGGENYSLNNVALMNLQKSTEVITIIQKYLT